MLRVPGAHHYQINYRHVIDSLLRKPGGFRNYRYRDDLFPLEVFRQAWDVLNEHLPPRWADLTYLRILKQAALGLESEVAQALRLLLDQDQGQNLWDEKKHYRTDQSYDCSPVYSSICSPAGESGPLRPALSGGG